MSRRSKRVMATSMIKIDPRWFNCRDLGHWLWLITGLGIGAGALLGVVDLRNAKVLDHPVHIIDVSAPFDRVALGGLYKVELVLDKRRGDCENGRVVRHMLELQRGWHYLSEQRPVLQLGPGKKQILALNLPTAPIHADDYGLMQPGLWKIISRLTYDCPDGDGSTVAARMMSRETTYETPPFTVLPPHDPPSDHQ